MHTRRKPFGFWRCPFVLVWALAALGASTPVPAAVLSDDFESGLGSWTTSGGTVAITGDQSVIGDPGDSQSMRLTDNSATSGEPYARTTFSGLSGTVYFQFDYRFEETDNVLNAGFQVRGTGGIGVNLHMTHVNTDDNPSHNSGSGFQVLTGTDLNTETWYRFTFTASTADDDYDLRIQSLYGNSIDDTYSNLGFQQALTDINEIRFLFNNPAANAEFFNVDNVLVTANPAELNFDIIPIPEPSTSVLMISGMGLVFLRRFRKRKKTVPSL